jgi:photosystem II stability/assembly factor-like uncharacterized protein
MQPGEVFMRRNVWPRHWLFAVLGAGVLLMTVCQFTPASASEPDSSSSWSSQTFSDASILSGVSCFTSMSCIAVGYGSDGGVILKTTDGGNTWTSEADPVPGALSGISCVLSTTDCYAVGNYDADLGVIIATTDGGSSWTSQTAPSGEDGLVGVSCPSTSTCIAVLGYNDGSETADPLIRTTDGGSSWVSVAAPAGVGDLDGISCSSESNCVAVGFGSGVVTSSDDGATWSAPTGGPDELGDVSCLLSTSFCAAVGGTPTSPGTAFFSSDEGSTWTAGSVPSGTELLSGVSCSSSADCEAVGGQSSGLSLTSTDGGSDWTSQIVPSGTGLLRSVACPSTSVCYAVGQSSGDNGLILVGGSALAITTTSLPAATIGQQYSVTLMASGGNPQYTWKLSSGKLPKGLKLDKSTGEISGTPSTKSQTSTFSVEVLDTKVGKPKTQNTATAALTITVSS